MPSWITFLVIEERAPISLGPLLLFHASDPPDKNFYPFCWSTNGRNLPLGSTTLLLTFTDACSAHFYCEWISLTIPLDATKQKLSAVSGPKWMINGNSKKTETRKKFPVKLECESQFSHTTSFMFWTEVLLGSSSHNALVQLGLLGIRYLPFWTMVTDFIFLGYLADLILQDNHKKFSPSSENFWDLKVAFILEKTNKSRKPKKLSFLLPQKTKPQLFLFSFWTWIFFIDSIHCV